LARDSTAGQPLAREIVRELRRDKPMALSASVADADVVTRAFLEAAGFQASIHSMLMVRDLAAPIPDLWLPPTIELRAGGPPAGITIIESDAIR